MIGSDRARREQTTEQGVSHENWKRGKDRMDEGKGNDGRVEKRQGFKRVRFIVSNRETCIDGEQL